MTGDRVKKFRRLAKAIAILHRMEAGELARVNAACVEIREHEAGVHAYLDANVAGTEFLAELAIVRAGRLREKLVEAEAELVRQIELTTGSMAKAEGAKKRIEAAVTSVEQASAARTLDDVIEAIVQSSSV